MSGVGPFDPAFFQIVQAEDAQLFDMAIRAGVIFIVLHVGGRGGIQAISYTYDKVKKFWQGEAEPSAQKAQQIGGSNDVDELRSTTRTRGFSDIEPTPKNMPQQQQQQQVELQQPQPRPQTGPVPRQVSQLKVGQPMLPVNDYKDHNDHDTTNDDNVPDQTEHQAYLERVSKGKHTDCPMWSNDPCIGERQQLLEAIETSNRLVEQLKEQLEQREAAKTIPITNDNAIIANAIVGQLLTPCILVIVDKLVQAMFQQLYQANLHN